MRELVGQKGQSSGGACSRYERPLTLCPERLLYSCSSDSDYVSTLGGDAGVRAHFLLGFDAENAALVTLAGGLSYTYFANSYENVAESQGLGTYARVGITYQRGQRFRVGLELGGRATYDFTFGGPWLEANLQVSMSRHF